MMANFTLIFSKRAREDLIAIRDRKTQTIIAKAIQKLESYPNERGKAMEHDFSGYRRLRAAQDYRIIYRVKEVQGQVIICVIALRKVAYDVAKKRLQHDNLEEV